ncbi:hypothetical protein [Dactylosporangium sp. CA-233914]|uniref:hypothetical protein n=1 Tax=Dactylosporangium sp. CA-233914 TaxID=3239934 RepID=UPI003D8D4D76
MTRLLDALWDVLSDFRGADLQTAPALAVEDLDGVCWSDATMALGATLWPDDLREVVDIHSEPTPGHPGMFTIRFGTPLRITR